MGEPVVDRLRAAAAEVARRARSVETVEEALPAYAESLRGALAAHRTAPVDPEAAPAGGTREERAAFWLTLDAVNFGSGWFTTLRKRPGRSGYFTVAIGLRERFAERGMWSAAELAAIDAAELALVTGQDRDHPLIELYAGSLRDLGGYVAAAHGGSFAALADAAGASAVALAEQLGERPSFADSSRYDELDVPFLKRAQIAAADLHRAGVARFADLARLTMFADNLVPHVLRLDGVLRFAPELVARIEREELIAHDSPEEVEIRACALHAVERLTALLPQATPAELDSLLWHRGQGATYKAVPRHRSRCTAY